MPYAPPEPRWDIVGEHLDEAEFLWGVWERSLLAPDHTLQDVARGPERRLHAHLDALAVNGPAVAPRLLVPALAGPTVERAAAAAAVLLASHDERDVDAVFAAWSEPSPQRPGLARALASSDRSDVVRRLRTELAGLDLDRVAAAAELLVFHGEPLGDALALLLAGDDPSARALALRAVPGETPRVGHLDAVAAGLADPGPVVVDAAVAAGTRLGLASAWDRARARADDRDGDESLLLLALANDAADRGRLLAALAHPKRRAGALWVLGFVGTREVVDACLEWLDDARLGPLAGEVFSAMTGVDLTRAGLTIPRKERILLDVTPEDALPRPDPLAVLRWWTRHRDEFTPGRRYLGGVPRTLAVVLAALERGPMRRRPALLLDLELRAGARARPRLQPRAPTSRQRRQFAALAQLAGVDLDRPLA